MTPHEIEVRRNGYLQEAVNYLSAAMFGLHSESVRAVVLSRIMADATKELNESRRILEEYAKGLRRE